MQRRLETGSRSGSIDGVKLSVSLTERDVDRVDRYAREHDVRSRSAVLHEAIEALEDGALIAEYIAGAEEAEAEASAWDGTVADGLEADAAR